MAVMRNASGTDIMLDCRCGCDDGVRIRVDRDDPDYYCFMTYTNGEFYRAQGDTFWGVFCKKMKKIWAILRNKDYYYSEIVMSNIEFNTFREYLDQVARED